MSPIRSNLVDSSVGVNGLRRTFNLVTPEADVHMPDGLGRDTAEGNISSPTAYRTSMKSLLKNVLLTFKKLHRVTFYVDPKRA